MGVVGTCRVIEKNTSNEGEIKIKKKKREKDEREGPLSDQKTSLVYPLTFRPSSLGVFFPSSQSFQFFFSHRNFPSDAISNA